MQSTNQSPSWESTCSSEAETPGGVTCEKQAGAARSALLLYVKSWAERKKETFQFAKSRLYEADAEADAAGRCLLNLSPVGSRKWDRCHIFCPPYPSFLLVKHGRKLSFRPAKNFAQK